MKSFYEISAYHNQPLHRLSDVLFAALLSFLRNSGDYSDMALFARRHEAFLKEFIPLENGIPSCDTFARVFSVLEPDLFRRCLYTYRKGVTEILTRKTIDSKPENATVIQVENNALPVVQAWISENCLRFVLKKPAKEESEPTFASLIEGINIQNAVVSADTGNRQKEFASLIAGKSGHYFLPLTERSELHNAAVNAFDSHTVDRSSEIREYNHGRFETRRCSIIDAGYIFSERTPEIPEGLKTLIKTDSVIVTEGKDTRKTRYYMSNEADTGITYFNVLADALRKTNLLCILFRDEPHSLIIQENARENLFMLKRFAVQVNREVGILNRMYFNADTASS